MTFPAPPIGERAGFSFPARALVVGFGSIGVRHTRILMKLVSAVAVVSRRDVEFPHVYRSLEEGLATHRPDYVVVANSTAEHHVTLDKLCMLGFSGTVLVEKPVFDSVRQLPPHQFSAAYVAYNLRFHPLLQRLRDALSGQIVISVQAYAGQHLPDWRPGTDYRNSYSASAAQGGGVLRDLSHEIDYLMWLLGGWQRVVALGGHHSGLEIDSDDVFALMLVTARCPIVTLQLNYLDRPARRAVIVNTEAHTYEVDLVKQTFVIDGAVEQCVVERDTTYLQMHRDLLSGQPGRACTFGEGLETLRLIAAAERSSVQQRWIER